MILAIFLVAIATLADIIGAFAVVRHLWRPAASRLLISFATGTLLALVFFDLLPESLEEGEEKLVFGSVLLGLLILFLFERFVAWYHCHDDRCEVHSNAPSRRTALLSGSFFEEFVDGAAVGLAMVFGGPPLAIVTTVAIFAHELPETASKVVTLASFGVEPPRAMRLVLLTTLGGFFGVVAALFFAAGFADSAPYLVALSAGAFLYIATADLIPELHHTVLRRAFMGEILTMFLGIAAIIALGALFES